MCGSNPAPPAPVVPPKVTPAASDPNVTAEQANAGVGQTSDNSLSTRKSLNIDLSSAGRGGVGLSIPQ